MSEVELSSGESSEADEEISEAEAPDANPALDEENLELDMQSTASSEEVLDEAPNEDEDQIPEVVHPSFCCGTIKTIFVGTVRRACDVS